MARSLRCPRCSTVVTIEEGQIPVCPACGFGGPVAAIPATPPPSAALPPTPPASFVPPPQPPAPGGLQMPSMAPPPPATSASAAWPAAPRPRPGPVTFVAVLGFIRGGFDALIGLALAVGGPFFSDLMARYGNRPVGMAGTFIGIVFSIFGVFLVLIAILQLVVAANVMAGREWARVVQLVLSFISGLISLLLLAGGGFLSLVGLGFDIATIAILFGQDARTYFRQGQTMRYG